MKKTLTAILSLALLLSLIPLTPAAEAAGMKTLTFTTDAVYESIYHMTDGLILAYKDGEYQYINQDGNTVLGYQELRQMLLGAGVSETELTYSDSINFTPFREGIALVTAGGRSIFFDKTGRVVATAKNAYAFSEGYAREYSEQREYVGLINTRGERVASKDFSVSGGNGDYYFGSYVHNGLLEIWLYNEYGVCVGAGYLNTALEIAIPLEFENVRPFNNGLAFAMKGGKWGVIDVSGQFVIQPQFNSFWVNDYEYSYTVFHEGLAAVERDGKWGYIDTSGKTAVPFTLACDEDSNILGMFCEGLSYLIQGGKCGYIDTAGNTVVPLIYDDVNFFSGGTALVGSGGKYKLINAAGQAVSNREWTFDSTATGFGTPGLIYYSQNGKWGLARVTDAAESPSEWAVPEVARAAGLGLVPELFTSGYSLATTRAEFCALGVLLYEKVTGAPIAGRETFNDTSDINVQKLASLGVVNGVGDGKFDPGAPLTREQAATIIARLMNALGKSTPAAAPDFKDNTSFAAWSYDAIGVVQSLGIMNGRDDGTFDPKAGYSREQCIATMLRAYDCAVK